MKYHFAVHKQARGFWAECVELPGCYTQAQSETALMKNMRESLNLFLDEPDESPVTFALPRKKVLGKNIITVEVDPHIAFAFCLRRIRILSDLTQREVAKKLDFKNLYSYQRLESSRTANPRLRTIVALKRVFPDLAIDEL